MLPTPHIPTLPPRSAGPAAAATATAATATAGPRRQGFDPVQAGWLDLDRRDDIDPESCDPLRQGPDRLAALGLAFRPWLRSDLADFHALLDDPAVWTHLPEPFPQPFDTAAAATLIDLANRLDSHVVRAVLRQGRPVGQVRLDMTAGPGRAEISYWLGRDHWGQGLGAALVAAATQRAFARNPDLLKLVAKVRPGNPASARVLERAGYTPLAQPPRPGFDGWLWFGLRRQALPSPATG